MGRLKVEGYVEAQNAGNIPNTTAVIMLEGSDDPAVAYRRGGGAKPAFLHDTGCGSLFNRDSILHNFQYFLRGTGVPGGEIDLTAVYTGLNLNDPAAGVTLPLPMYFPLLEGQHYDVKMVEVIGTVIPTFTMSYRDVVLSQNDIRVSGRRVTQVLELITTVTGPLVIAGPTADDDFTTRELLSPANAQDCLLIFNSGAIAAAVTATLTTPEGTVVLFSAAALAAGAVLVLPVVLNLREGYSLSVATSTANAELAAVGAYTDLI